jgi:hypothetical protein
MRVVRAGTVSAERFPTAAAAINAIPMFMLKVVRNLDGIISA